MMLGLLLALAGPASAAEHTLVEPGEDLAAVAARVGVSAADLVRENALAPGAALQPGQLLDVPGAGDGGPAAAVLAWFGPAVATPPGGAPVPVQDGMRLALGTVVCTEAGGDATVRLAVAAGGRVHDDVTLLPETCLEINATSARPGRRTSLLTLARGSVTVQEAEDGGGAGTVTVQTRAGVTSGEGGFRVHVEEEATRTEALARPLLVAGGGRALRLQAGEGSRTRVGEGPGAPVKLLRPGAPTAPPNQAALRRPDFAWRPVDGNLGYLVEVSSTPRFDNIVLAEEVPDPPWLPEALLVPYRVPGLWWRVTAYDSLGFLGLPSAARGLQVPQGLGR
jgi:murein DD-endopeptidase MepM/ murein hydrolase activator NlpD